MSKVIDLAKKLKALAEGGVGGERVNAAAQLSRLMAKHGISAAELEGEAVSARYFAFTKITEEFISAVIFNTVPRVSLYVVTFRGSKKKQLKADMTAAQFLECQAKIRFYGPLLEKEIKRSVLAFVVANSLFSEGPAPAGAESSLSREDIRIIAKRAGTMDATPFRKGLTR